MSLYFRKAFKVAAARALRNAQRMEPPKGANKLTIKVDEKDIPKLKYKRLKQSVIVQYNPQTFEYAWNVQWSGVDKEGNQLSTIQYKGMDRRSLTLNLVFDAREAAVDDVNEIVKPLEMLSKPIVGFGSDNKLRPPYFRLSWGTVEPIRGVLKSFGKQYTLFSQEGVPIRAKVTLNIEEYIDPEAESKEAQAGDPEQFYTVKTGDKLPDIAYHEYGDEALWRIIAAANNIENLFVLQTGTRLFIPALDTVEDA